MIGAPQFYKLIGKLPVPCSMEEWVQWCVKRGEATAVVKQDKIGPLFVSTVFLGLDHNILGSEPLLFETMIFDDFHDAYQTRCTTWDQAELMHEVAVAEATRRVEASENMLRSQPDGTSSRDHDDPAQGTVEGKP